GRNRGLGLVLYSERPCREPLKCATVWLRSNHRGVRDSQVNHTFSSCPYRPNNLWRSGIHSTRTCSFPHEARQTASEDTMINYRASTLLGATPFPALAIASFFAVTVAFTPGAWAQGKWRVGAPIPEGANEVIGAALDGQIYVYGGQDSANKPQGLFFRYDPTKNEW